MKYRLQAVAATLLAATLVVPCLKASGATPPAKKHARKAHTAKPSVEDQIQALRQEMQSQIDSLKSSLAEKDAALKQAQQAAEEAKAAAAKAEQAADAQQQAFTQNSAAVSTLQSSVSDLKSSQSSLETKVSHETEAIRKEVSAPDALRYKGITISPAGSFLAAETVWRSGATGGGLDTQFAGVPLANSDAAQLSEFYGSGRQSRVALKAQGKLSNMTLTGYYEADWLSAGTTSNSNQSNSYTMRQRQLWAEAALNDGWVFSGGQGWSLATENTHEPLRATEILPATVDPQYTVGFVWERQYSFRVSKSLGDKFFLAAAVENPETLNPSGQNLPTNLLIGSAGNGGGLYNSLANYSFNLTPDFIVKAEANPGWGHWELFGIGRSFRDRIYPTGGTPHNDTVWGGGIGGGFRGPLANKKLSVGLKGLYGAGVGRYGSSTIADVTIRPDGTLSPLHGFSALGTLEANPTKRLMLYANYGGDYIGRDWTLNSSNQEVGYGTYTAAMSGCNTEATPSGSNTGGFNPANPAACSGSNKDVQEFTAGWWFDFYSGPKGRLRQGLQYAHYRRDLWSGTGGVNNPGGGAHGDENEVFTSFRYYLP